MLTNFRTLAAVTLFTGLAFSSPLPQNEIDDSRPGPAPGPSSGPNNGGRVNGSQPRRSLRDPDFLRILGYKDIQCNSAQQSAPLIDDPAAQESRLGECMNLNTPGPAWRVQLYAAQPTFNSTLYMYHKACGEPLVNGDVFETFARVGIDDNQVCYRGDESPTPDWVSVCFGAACPQV